MIPNSIRRNLRAFAAILLFLAAPILVASGLVERAEAAVVSKIVVEGNQRVDGETIRAYLLIRPGVEYSRYEEDESLKALFQTGLFAHVSLDTRGSTLFVVVEENPVINEVAFEGNKKFKDDQLLARRPVAAARRLHARQGADGRAAAAGALPALRALPGFGHPARSSIFRTIG